MAQAEGRTCSHNETLFQRQLAGRHGYLLQPVRNNLRHPAVTMVFLINTATLFFARTSEDTPISRCVQTRTTSTCPPTWRCGCWTSTLLEVPHHHCCTHGRSWGCTQGKTPPMLTAVAMRRLPQGVSQAGRYGWCPLVAGCKQACALHAACHSTCWHCRVPVRGALLTWRSW